MDRIAYIAGPMRGYEDFNYPAFFALEEFLEKSSCFAKIYNPARMDSDIGGVLVGADGRITNECLRDCLRRDVLTILDDCTTLVLANNWHGSKGAQAEYALAKAIGLEILTEDALRYGNFPGSLPEYRAPKMAREGDQYVWKFGTCASPSKV